MCAVYAVTADVVALNVWQMELMSDHLVTHVI